MARAIEVDLDAVEKEFYTDLTANYYDSYGRGFTAGLKAMLGFLKEQPTIEPKQEWIRTKDRLPTEEDSTSGMVIAVENDKERRVKPWHWDIVVKYANEFTHWMPLPEPPKEGE